MNIKRLIWAIVVVFAILQITDPIIHGYILASSYEALPGVWRENMDAKMWIMILNSLMFSILFVYFFAKGYEEKGIMEGVRFGILTALFVFVYSAINQYVVYPLPFTLIVKWAFYGFIQFLLCGVATAYIYKSTPAVEPE